MGVARMGNSPDHFLASETPGVPVNWNDGTGTFRSFRDSEGRILRQGARFRVFEYEEDPSGNLSNPREISIAGEVTDIEWRVHLANRKASFFAFHGQFGARDNYLERTTILPGKIIAEDPDRTNLRNAAVPQADRAEKLEIDPGEQSISRVTPATVELKNAKPHIPIDSLGTLLLDDKGRLVVLGGYGQSNSTEHPPRKIDDYANNDTWFDDSSDGSVRARIRFSDGKFIDADPAWVFVGPPDFAPGIGNVVSLYDTLWDTAVRDVSLTQPTPTIPALVELKKQKDAWTASGGKSLQGYKPSFTRDIYPLLKRAFGARDVHVSGITHDHFHETMFKVDQLNALTGSLAKVGAELRAWILTEWIRDPDGAEADWKRMPRGLGDDYTALDEHPEAPTPQSFLSLTRVQYALLREWAASNFIDDWSGAEPQLSTKPDPTPDDLDRAATENCVGGPFFPGIEVSWLIRVKNLYAEPFRLHVSREPEDANTTAPPRIGAIEFRPGFFSQQMALPWQADFYDCHKERQEDPDGTEYYFMWWSAQRPDDVFPSGATTRERWVREFDKQKTTDDPDDLQNLERFNQMQSKWHQLKFVAIKSSGHYEEEP
jgi:hypothetical protein